MHGALFYKRIEAEKVRCELCAHNCLIADGRRGICGVRENQKGVLYSLVYGKLAAASIDPIEKKPLFHFLPGSTSYSISTVGCNFHCAFCQNFGLSQSPREKYIIEGEDVEPQAVVEAALSSGCKSISYTYTEPTIYFEYAQDIAECAKAKGLKNVFVSNGFMNPPVASAAARFLAADNVDLKSFRDEYYRKICGGRLQPVLDTLKLLKKLGVWVEVTTLVIPGLNDSKEELTDIAGFIKNEMSDDTPWHVSGFYPTYKMTDRPPTPPQSLIKAREIGLAVGLKYVYAGNAPIPDGENTHCSNCKKTLVERYGFTIKNNVIKEGRCPDCSTPVSGVWS